LDDVVTETKTTSLHDKGDSAMERIHFKKFVAGLTASAAVALAASSAFAGKETIEQALAGRPEVSQFYEALKQTGVINELGNRSYTVFAPTNDAFNKLTAKEYPCLYSPQCTEKVADILRNHITEGEVLLSDAVRGSATFSIDKAHLRIHEPQKGRYTVDGHKVDSQNQLVGNVLYVIDGVIASNNELAELRKAPVVATKPVTTTQETVTREYRYRENGAPAATVDSVTTIKRTESPRAELNR
jgi:uncharacterized surface protein with fasciclin (FAS1) repeats